MLEFYTSGVLGQKSNTLYPTKIEVTDEASLKKAVSHDYVCASYTDFRRGNSQFIESNCLAFDVDNDGSDDERTWINPQTVMETFPGVTVAFHFSRHHMIDKKYIDVKTGKMDKTVKARPRFHVFFEINPLKNYSEYKDLKSRVQSMFPYFDKGAMDSARFFFGTKDPQVLYHQGAMTLSDYLLGLDSEEDLSIIREGSRNTTLSKYAAKVLKRFGNTHEAYLKFLEMHEKCEVPLEDSELNTIWESALRFYKNISSKPDYIPPEQYGLESEFKKLEWDDPLPFGGDKLPVFPVHALPPVLSDYAEAVGKSTQTSVDMAAVSVLATASACMRNLYKVEGKADWHEPTNIYCVIIAEPSERKSAVISLATRPVDEFIKEYNEAHRVDFEMSKATKQNLENKKNSLISQSRKKGEADAAMDFDDSLRNVIQQIVDFKEIKPLKIYVDDTTPEKLTEILAENNGSVALISSEGGIFDVLSGTYTNKVNIDVFLKAYSCENISVERIMRQSISVNGACLIILLSVQPVVIEELMSNKKFRHRGLTARFLYSTPKSFVGTRILDSDSIPNSAYQNYRALIYNLLSEEHREKVELIRLTSEARDLLTQYYDWVEKLLVGEFSMYSDWLGKLVGNTLRIAGILARCSVIKKDIGDAVFETDSPVIIDKRIMENAIAIGKYFFVHAVNSYGDMGIRSGLKAAEMVVEKIREKKLSEITKRDLMRYCRWIGSADEAQDILSNLEDYGYIRLSSLDAFDKLRNGRPKNAVYAVNPLIIK